MGVSPWGVPRKISWHPYGITVQLPPSLVFRGSAISSEMLHVWLFPAVFQDNKHLSPPVNQSVTDSLPFREFGSVKATAK